MWVTSGQRSAFAQKMNISKLLHMCSCPSCQWAKNAADVEIESFIEKPVKANPELFEIREKHLKSELT